MSDEKAWVANTKHAEGNVKAARAREEVRKSEAEGKAVRHRECEGRGGRAF